jgi:transcriptional regulator GlxA family with amidase domain
MIVGMPVYHGTDVLDVCGPLEMFTWAQYEVLLVAEHPGIVGFTGGLRVDVTMSFEAAPQFDVLWVPGGTPNAIAAQTGDPKRTYLDFLLEQSLRAQYITSVCDGALLLAAAGLLDGHTATTHWEFLPCFARFPKVTVAPGYPRYVVSGNRVVTGGGVSSGLDESLELIKMISGEAAAEQVQLSTQYFPRPPVHATIPGAEKCPVPDVPIPPIRKT